MFYFLKTKGEKACREALSSFANVLVDEDPNYLGGNFLLSRSAPPVTSSNGSSFFWARSSPFLQY